MVVDGRVVVGVDAERGENPSDLVVEGHRAGTVIGLRPALHESHPMTFLAQQNRQQGPGRTGTDDNHIGVIGLAAAVGTVVCREIGHVHCHCCHLRMPDRYVRHLCLVIGSPS
ncbi:hypothetical protein D3C78_1248570 [compost metagenome]